MDARRVLAEEEDTGFKGIVSRIMFQRKLNQAVQETD